MRPLPSPGIYLMHGNLSAVQPSWGKCGMWKWWAWKNLHPNNNSFNFGIIDAYLDAAKGRPVAISIMPYPEINQDLTPQWVYGSGTGWPIVGGTGTFPKWNDYAWDTAMRQVISALGRVYDADPRVSAVWICTARYGETVTSGLGSNTHNPGRYFSNMVEWYDEAFPTKPIMILNTGPTDRLSLSNLAWSKGMCAKFNALCRDLPTHKRLQPPGEGHAEIAKLAMDIGSVMGWEHYYPENGPETYWAMITAIALGATVIDLPERHLNALASIPGLWDWMLKMMQARQDQIGLYVARDTDYPPPGNGWECGWPGPWERGISTNATCYAPKSEGYQRGPLVLRSTLEGFGGLGQTSGPLSVTLDLPAGNYVLEVTYCPLDQTAWTTLSAVAQSPGTITLPTGASWVHRVVALPYGGTPEPPPDPLDELRIELASLNDSLRVLALDQVGVSQRLDGLLTQVNSLAWRLGSVEGRLDAMKAALE